MHQDTLIAPSTGTHAIIRCFGLYADYPAGIRAKRLIRQMAGFMNRRCEFYSEMWKLDSVAPVGTIRKMIAQAAGESDIILLAATSCEPDRALLEWLNSLVPWKSNRLVPGLLIGLVNDFESNESNWLSGELGNFAQRTGMRLIWKTADREAIDESERLASSVECLLQRKQLCREY